MASKHVYNDLPRHCHLTFPEISIVIILGSKTLAHVLPLSLTKRNKMNKSIVLAILFRASPSKKKDCRSSHLLMEKKAMLFKPLLFKIGLFDTLFQMSTFKTQISSCWFNHMDSVLVLFQNSTGNLHKQHKLVCQKNHLFTALSLGTFWLEYYSVCHLQLWESPQASPPPGHWGKVWWTHQCCTYRVGTLGWCTAEHKQEETSPPTLFKASAVTNMIQVILH